MNNTEIRIIFYEEYCRNVLSLRNMIESGIHRNKTLFNKSTKV